MFHIYCSKSQVNIISCLTVHTSRSMVSVSYLLYHDLHDFYDCNFVILYCIKFCELGKDELIR